MLKIKSVIISLLLLSPTLFQAQNYFQQEVNYTINVTLDDVKNELSANETLIYKNNSPTALPFIYMHLWANGYKNNTTPLAKNIPKKINPFWSEEQNGAIPPRRAEMPM